MLKRCCGIGLLSALIIILPLLAADDKKGKKDNPLPTPVDSDKLPAGDYSGKLVTVPATDGSFTLQIDTKRYEPKNPGQLSKKESDVQLKIQQSQQKIANLQAQILASRTPRDAAHHQTQLQQEMNHLQQKLRLV